MTYWLLLSINFLVKILCLVSGISLVGKKQPSKKWNYMGVYLVVCFVSEISAFLLAYYRKNNMPVFYVFVPVLFILAMLFLEAGNERIHKMRVSGWLAPLLLGSSVVSYHCGLNWKDPNALTSILGTMVIIAATTDSIILQSSFPSVDMDRKLNMYVLYVLLFYSLGTLSVWIFFGVFSPGNYPLVLHRIIFYFLYVLTNATQLSLALLLFPKCKKKNL